MTAETNDEVAKIAAAVLYEGYVLWPYRRSAPKNRQRWTLGGVYPRAWSERVGGDDSDPWFLQTECLVTGEAPLVTARVRFLQVVQRRVARIGGDGRREFVDELTVGGERFLSWEEAVEREVVVSLPPLSGLALSPGQALSPGPSPKNRGGVPDKALDSGFARGHRPDGPQAKHLPMSLSGTPPPSEERAYIGGGAGGEGQKAEGEGNSGEGTLRVPITIAAGSAEEPLRDENGTVAGAIVREWDGIEAEAEASAERLDDSLWRVRLRVANTLAWDPANADRQAVLRRTPVSTHAVLTVEGGAFVSLLEPPPAFAGAAAECRNVKTWPVLAGAEGSSNTMLSSPIILYDYPRVAPESGGDFFDGGEIDQLLMLNIVTLTDEEKAEMRATDPRTREILERAESMTTDDFMGLHGVIREFRLLGNNEVSEGAADLFADPFAALHGDPVDSVEIGGRAVRAGSRVRLRPKGTSSDAFDLALAGKVGIVESIEQDFEGRVHLTVTAEDDPGRALGEMRILGHRFFFSPDEVEPLPAGEEAAAAPAEESALA